MDLTPTTQTRVLFPLGTKHQKSPILSRLSYRDRSNLQPGGYAAKYPTQSSPGVHPPPTQSSHAYSYSP
jgi:hypothetical protein